MKKGQMIIVTNEAFKEQVTFFEVVLFGNEQPNFTGEIVAVNPTSEEFATLDENFASAVEAGAVGDIVEGVIYFDAGASRAFLVDHEDVALLS